MNLTSQPGRITTPVHTRHLSSENGMASLIFITLLAIMMILVMAELHCLFHLHREVRFLEQQQVKRLESAPAIAVRNPPTLQKPASP